MLGQEPRHWVRTCWLLGGCAFLDRVSTSQARMPMPSAGARLHSFSLTASASRDTRPCKSNHPSPVCYTDDGMSWSQGLSTTCTLSSSLPARQLLQTAPCRLHPARLAAPSSPLSAPQSNPAPSSPPCPPHPDGHLPPLHRPAPVHVCATPSPGACMRRHPALPCRVVPLCSSPCACRGPLPARTRFPSGPAHLWSSFLSARPGEAALPAAAAPQLASHPAVHAPPSRGPADGHRLATAAAAAGIDAGAPPAARHTQVPVAHAAQAAWRSSAAHAAAARCARRWRPSAAGVAHTRLPEQAAGGPRPPGAHPAARTGTAGACHAARRGTAAERAPAGTRLSGAACGRWQSLGAACAR